MPSTSSRGDGLRRWLGGAGDRTALHLTDGALSYPAFAAAVLALELSPAGLVAVNTRHGAGRSLITLFAALADGRPVLVTDGVSAVEHPSDRERTQARGMGEHYPDGTLLLTTSGSSGAPRVVCRTAESWHCSFRPFTDLAALTSDDTVALTGPLHSTMQLFAAVHTLWLGATLTDDPGRATAVHCVPSTLDALLRSSRLPAVAIVAGSGLPAALADQVVNAGTRVVEYYGAAELSFVAARRYPEPLRAFPGVHLEFRGGELWARSPYLALGYASGGGALRTDADGYATVGDLADLNRNGSIRIRGRGDAAITTAGVTVLAEDVEAVLAAAPGVAAVAVVGLAHPRLGHLLVAVVDFDGEPAELHRYARQRLTGGMLPRRWYRGPLPRTSTGKVNRAALRDRLTAGTGSWLPL